MKSVMMIIGAATFGVVIAVASADAQQKKLKGPAGYKSPNKFEACMANPANRSKKNPVKFCNENAK